MSIPNHSPDPGPRRRRHTSWLALGGTLLILGGAARWWIPVTGPSIPVAVTALPAVPPDAGIGRPEGQRHLPAAAPTAIAKAASTPAAPAPQAPATPPPTEQQRRAFAQLQELLARQPDAQPPAGTPPQPTRLGVAAGSSPAVVAAQRKIQQHLSGASRDPARAPSAEYYVQPAASLGGWRVENPNHRLATEISELGITVRPRLDREMNPAENPRAEIYRQEWQVDLQLRALGYEGALRPVEAGTLEERANQLEHVRPGLTEWYVNTGTGLEQGFTLEQPPTERPAPGAPLRLEFRLGTGFTAEVSPDGTSLQLSTPDGQAVLRYADLLAFDATGRQLPARLELTEGIHLAMVVDDRAARYPVMVDPVLTGLVKDINLNTEGSNPYSLVNVNGTLYFAAFEISTGTELWKSDGTAAGTVLIKDINPGPSSSSLNYLTAMGNTLYFTTSDPSYGTELWRSDGTTAGTVMVRDINPGPGSSSPYGLKALGGTLFFTANDGTTSNELWKSDGTAAGTVLVKDIYPGGTSSSPGSLTAVGNTLYFTATDPTYGNELWRSDGTTAGTVMIKDIYQGTPSSGPYSLAAVGSTLFFTAIDPTYGYELWKSDGTEAGTIVVKDINPGVPGSGPGELTAVGSTLYFNAYHPSYGTELWKSDGTASGTVQVADLFAGSNSSNPGYLKASGSFIYFMTTFGNGFSGGANYYRYLYRSDGTVAGTIQLAYLNGYTCYNGNGCYGSFYSPELTAVGSVVYFRYGPSGEVLGRTDGSTAGTAYVYGFDSGSVPSGLAAVGSQVFFGAGGSGYTAGRELWKSDGTAAGTTLVKDINGQGVGSFPSLFAAMGNALYFQANDGVTGPELWKSDGTPAGTVLVKDIYPGLTGSVPQTLTAVGSTLYFIATDPTYSRELWKSDGTSAGTTMVKDIYAGGGGSSPQSLTAVGSTLYFNAFEGSTGWELWKSDGTAAGTVLVKDIYGGGGGSYPSGLTAVGNTLYFNANDATNGNELWKSDGTTAGTVLVKDIYPGSPSGNPAYLTAVGSTLYFTASDPSYGSELWMSDGTTAGTVLVKDIYPGSNGSGPQNLTPVGGTLYFSASEPTTGLELWKSDGTTAGTVMVKDIYPGSLSGNPSYLTAVGNTLYFRAAEPTTGQELWKSDGTTAGTVLVKDIFPGGTSGDPIYLTAVGDVFFFNAQDSTHGRELWRSDGTAAGTVLAADLWPGANSSNPQNLRAFGQKLFFAASDGQTGTELWYALDIPNLAPTDLALAPSVVAENQPAGTVVGLLATTDPDAADTHSYTLVTGAGDNDNSLFSVVGAEIRTAAIFDFETKNSYSIRVRSTDNGGLYLEQPLSIQVANVNEPPVAVNDDYALDEDTTLSPLTAALGLLKNDTDPDGDTLTAILVNGPTHGALALQPDGRFTYTPEANFNGPDSFTYRVSDGQADSGVATVTITVNPVNDAPVAVAQSVTTAEDAPVALLLAGTDADADPLSYTVATAPAHGTLSGTAPNLTYTPAANYHGPDSFTFTVADGTATSAPATVAITVTTVNDGDPGDVVVGLALAANGPVFSTTPQPDGRLLVGGGFTTFGGLTRNSLARVNADGTVDTGFNPNANGQVNAAAIQRDGKIVVGGGFTTMGGMAHNRLARLNPDGSVDATFNPDFGHQVLAVAIQTDGRILVGGYFTSVNGTPRNYVARLNEDGTLDTGFNPNASGFVYGAALQPDGRIVVGGNFTAIGGVARNYSARLNADGSVDAGFNPSADGQVRSTVLQPDGRLVIAGNFYTVGGQPRGSVARLNPNGTLDTGFNPNADAVVHSLSLQTDGRIVLGGAFSTVGGQPRSRVARVNPDGTLDPSFNPEVSGSSVFTTAVGADGQVAVGGIFGTVGGLTRGNVAWLSNDGATQALTVPGPDRVQWLRGGASPEAQSVTFESSKDGGATWTDLGSGTRITGGWEKTGLHLTGVGKVRARARLTGGYYNGSSGLAEATAAFAFNSVPVALAQSVTTAEDTSLAITLSASDADQDPLSFAIVGAPSHGSLGGTPPNLTYAPAANYHGADSFTFRVNDGLEDSALATVTISVTSVNDAPVAANDSFTTAEDTALTVGGAPARGGAGGTVAVVDRLATFDALQNGTDLSNYTEGGLRIATPATAFLNLGAAYYPSGGANGATSIRPTDGSKMYAVEFYTYDGWGSGHVHHLHWWMKDNGVVVADGVFSAGDPLISGFSRGAGFDELIVGAYYTADLAAAATPTSYQALGLDNVKVQLKPPGVLANDADVEGDALSAQLVSGPAHGTVNLLADGGFTYTPEANFNGVDSFTYRASDGSAVSEVATVSITVTPVNDAPAATAQSVTTAEDTVAVLTLAGADVDGDPLTYTITGTPAHGTLSGTGPNLSYRPWPHYHGPDQFTFQVNDGMATASATVTVTVTPVNDVPVATSTAVTTAEDTAAGITLTAADVEAVGYSVLQVLGSDSGAGRSPSGGLIEGADQKLYGTTEFGGAGDNGTVFRMNPDGSGYTVLHSFAASRSQGVWPRGRLVAGPGGVLYGTTTVGGNSNSGTVWKLNTDGTGFAVLLHKNGFPGSSSGLLLGRDGMLYGTTVFGGASGNGTVFKVGTDGSGYAVLHNFTGLANQGGRPYAQLVEDTAGVLYGTTEVGGADAVNGGTVFKLQKDGTGYTVLQAFAGGTGNPGTLRRGLLLASDGALYGVTPTGGQNAKGTVFKVQRNGTGFQLLHQFAADGKQGGIPQAALVEDADGVLYGGTTAFGALGGGTIFRLNKDGTGFGVLHHFGAGAADGNQMQGELAVAGNGRLYGTTFAGAAPGAGVLFALERATAGLDYTVTTAPTHGTLSGTAANLTYTPAANYNGADSFTYVANDATVDSAPATVSITVTAVNDAPVADSQTVAVAEDGVVTITLTGSDVDGDLLSLGLTGGPAHGSVSINSPTVTYRPAANYHGPDALTFVAHDGKAFSAPATISITVTPVNDPPEDRDRTLSVWEDNGGGQVQPQVDVDGDAVTYFVVTPPQHGRVELQGGNLIYLPEANYTGPDSYTFKATDGTLESPLYTYTITVLPVNDAPVASVQSVTTAEDTAVTITLGGSDVDGDALNFAVVHGPAHGSLSGTAPNLTYTPAPNYHGPDSLTFTANDGTVTSAAATVSITVTPVNDPPVAVDDSYTLSEDGSLVAAGGIGSRARGFSGTAVGSVDRSATFDAVVTGTDLDGYIEGGLRVSVPKVGFISGALFGGYFYPNGGANAATSIRTTDGSKIYALEFATSDGWGDPHPVSYLHWWMLENGIIVADGVLETGHRTVSGFSRGAGFDELLVGAYYTAADATAATPVSYQALALDNLKVQLTRPGVLANDTDADGDPMSVQLESGPQHGTVTLAADGGFTYSPEANFEGTDTFTYRVNDGSTDSELATVSLTVTAVNDLPSAEGQDLTTYDNQPLAITLAGSDVETNPLTYRIVTGPAAGTLGGTPPNLTYTAPYPYAGAASFTFEVEDADGAKAQATVAITILASDRRPVAVAGDDLTVAAGPNCLATVTVDGGGSSDPDGDVLGYQWSLVQDGQVIDSVIGSATAGWTLPLGAYEAVLTVSYDKGGTTVSATDTMIIDVVPSAPVLAALNPAGAYANGPGFNLTVSGGCFLPGAVVHWNGQPRPTTVVNSSQVVAQIPAADLQTGVDITVAAVQVVNGDGQASNPLGFSIVAQTVGTADAAVSEPGQTSTVSTAPTTSGDPGVTVSVQNGGTEPVTVLAATYDTKPVGETAFQVDNGSYVDVQVAGATANVAAKVFFYYPATTTGGMENRVKLRWFDGANWIAVLSSGGLPPAKDTTDNLDGTVSGGRFTAIFDATSTPTISQLTGTVFGMFPSEPQLGTLTGPTGPVALGNTISITANFAVVGDPADASVRFLWADGTESTVIPQTATSATASHRYASPGVYGVTVQVTDGQGDVREGRYEYVVIYDPNGGFVTGGGWIESAPGAYLYDLTLSGKATFGFNSKYLKGQSVPSGQTQFQFQAGDFRFQSTAYEWLVVSGAKAQYKGVGQVNGVGDYGFLLTATDGQLTGGGGLDRFRIKVWDRASGAVVYDNRRGASDDLTAADPQVISGGSIVIQKSK